MSALSLTPGTVVGARYRLEKQIGAGGVGVVWSAIDTDAGEPVALKVLHDETPMAQARFRREARALLALRHPGIVRVSDVVEDGSKVAAIVMELLSGETLRQRLLRQTPLPATETASILGRVALAVSHAHAQGVIHRDLKPENVFLVSGGARVVVLDFGLTRAKDRGAAPGSVVTEQGALLGTLPYMAPEQLLDASTVDDAVDVWSLGIILYECLAGFRPFEGESEVGLVSRILTDAVAPLSFVTLGVPAELARLAEQLLRRDRSERAGAMGEAARVLAHASSGE